MTHKAAQELQLKVAEYIRRHPDMTFTAMSVELGISLPYLSRIAIAHGLRRRVKTKGFVVTPEFLQKLEA